MIRRMVIAAILVLLAAPLVSAQRVQDRNFYVGPQVGLYFNEENDDDVNGLIGVAARARFAPAIGLEASVNYRQENFADDSLQVKSWPVLASLLLYPINSVYATLGGGWYNSTYDFEAETGIGDNTQNEFGWHMGGGVELPVGGRSLLTGDVKYVFLDYEPQDAGLFQEIDGDFFNVSIGLLIGF